MDTEPEFDVIDDEDQAGNKELLRRCYREVAPIARESGLFRSEQPSVVAETLRKDYYGRMVWNGGVVLQVNLTAHRWNPDSIKVTMLHELTHLQHSGHRKGFYETFEVLLRKAVERGVVGVTTIDPAKWSGTKAEERFLGKMYNKELQVLYRAFVQWLGRLYREYMQRVRPRTRIVAKGLLVVRPPLTNMIQIKRL